MIDIARNIVPCSDKQDMKSRNGSYFQPSFSTRKRQRISSDLFSELPQKRSKTTNGRIWTKATYSFSSQTLCTISSKVIRMWASFTIFFSLWWLLVPGFVSRPVRICFSDAWRFWPLKLIPLLGIPRTVVILVRNGFTTLTRSKSL